MSGSDDTWETASSSRKRKRMSDSPPVGFRPVPTNAPGTSREVNGVQCVRPTPRCPPIFVSGIQDVRRLRYVLDGAAGDNYTMKMVGREEVKVQPTASEKYAPIVQALRSEGSAFQTYKRKPDRNFRVVLRHVHPSTDPEEIVAELKRYGHSVVRMANLGRQEGSGPSPIFLLELEPRANNSEVFRVNRLLNRTVRFEPPHKRWDLRQCGLCQNFGHPREFCDRSPKPSGAACPRKEGTGGNQPVPGPSTRPDNSQTGNPGTCDLTKLEEGMRGILARLDSLLGLFSVLVGRTN